jgi:hypothetical protein
MRQLLVSGWAVLSVAATFVEAIYRLSIHALLTLRADLSPGEWLALLTSVVTFAYGEGYRALQRRFAPHVVTRAFEIGARPLRVYTLPIAPLYSLSLVAAPRRVLARAWLGVTLIVCAVLVVRALPFPWRGIIDAGVAVALAWGLCALFLEFLRRCRAGYTRPA